MSRRVLACFLEQQAQIWIGEGYRDQGQTCLGLAHRLRSGGAVELHHLRESVRAAHRETDGHQDGPWWADDFRD